MIAPPIHKDKRGFFILRKENEHNECTAPYHQLAESISDDSVFSYTRHKERMYPEALYDVAFLRVPFSCLPSKVQSSFFVTLIPNSTNCAGVSSDGASITAV